MTTLLDGVTLEETTEYQLVSGCDFVVHLGTHAVLEFWTGAVWKEYPSATGGETQGKDFIFTSPASGRVRMVIAEGQTAVVSLYPKDE